MIIGRRPVLAATGGLIAAPAIARAQAGKPVGVALVIGNSKYKWEAQLPNVARDAPDVARRFEAMRLRTELLENADGATLRAALERFKAMAHGVPFAAIYFAGHGAYIERTTYVVPIDADLTDAETVKNLISSGGLARPASAAQNSLLIFDSCRNNPADGARQKAAEELAMTSTNSTQPGSANDIMRQFPRQLRLYSTAPGRIALDGPPGQNSPFASAVMRALEAPEVNLRAFSGAVRRGLLLATGGRQLLWDVNPIPAAWVLRGASGLGGPSPPVSPVVEFDKAYEFARQSGFPLPDGLIGVRPRQASPQGQKVGSYRLNGNVEGVHKLELLVVLGVDEQGSADAVLAGDFGSTPYWRLVSARATGDRLEFQPRGGSLRYTLSWRDGNSGTVAFGSDRSTTGKNNKVPTSSFTRLDG